MVTQRSANFALTPFELWVESEGLQVITKHTVYDLATEPLEPWERTGFDAALLDLTQAPADNAWINNQGTTRYIVEIPPGGTFKAERHMYEELFYVVKGRGATVVWNEGSPTLTFESQEQSVFAISLNTWHEIYNGSGTETVRLYAATNMPTPFNLYGSPEFVFNCTNTFPDRFDPHDELYFTGKSTRLGDRLSESNFIPSVLQMTLDDYNHRGPGTNMYTLMAGGRFVAHVSEFPVASYKKGHGFSGTGTTTGGVSRTGLQSENSYLFLSGEGYDLQWRTGQKPGPGVDFTRYDFKKNSLMTNGHGGHQHFNTSSEPARYLVLRYGNPFFGAPGKPKARGHREDTGQIDYKDEDARIRALFEEECAKRGVKSEMAPV